MNKPIEKIFLLLTVFLGLQSCLEDVSHNNPLDPKNQNKGFTLDGKVNTFYAPVFPIANAVITLLPDNQKVFSNSTGNFQFTGIEPGLYTVLCNAERFSQDSSQINLQSNMTIDFFLDGLPFFENILLTTHHVSRFFPVEDMFFLQIEVSVSDPDGISDINHVFYTIPELSVIDTLETTLDAGIFNKRLSIDDLPVNTIQTLIGRAFILSVNDDAGKTVNSETQFLTRVIDITPILKEPGNLQIVPSDSIYFNWEKVRLPYFFTHKIEIFQINQGLLTKVSEFININEAKLDVTIENNLIPGDYVWILTVIDEYSNSSSSKEGTFRVSN